MRSRLLNLALQHEHDIVMARQRARLLAQFLGFDSQDRTRIATAVSEIARNAVVYAGGGQVQFFIESATARQLLAIEISDRGPGIGNLQEVLSGRYRSSTGMGRGIVGAQRLLDRLDIETSANGTQVVLKKVFPRTAPPVTAADLPRLAAELEAQLRSKPLSLLDELTLQNGELLAAIEEVESKRKELVRLNAELFDTNRGVLALYTELEEQADRLRRADGLKTRFLSNMSHEFRTPLNSTLALTRLLLDRTDGELTSEQERQIGYVRKGALDLMELVNDLLDLAKVESGQTVVRPTPFAVDDLFAALRGMIRPLLMSSSVELIFADAGAVPELNHDEAKIAQVLRNFLSNALKFTERGEIRVEARFVAAGERIDGLRQAPDRDSVLLSVTDTGIGIDPQDQERIFEEFAQVENPLQSRAKGTGLGLPLCRKLAILLEGEVWVSSAPGQGSQFFLLIPQNFGLAQTRIRMRAAVAHS